MNIGEAYLRKRQAWLRRTKSCDACKRDIIRSMNCISSAKKLSQKEKKESQIVSEKEPKKKKKEERPSL